MVISLADTLARLHRATLDEADRAQLADCSIAALLSRLAIWVEEADAQQLKLDLRDIEKRLAQLVERPACLVHGDCHPGNILIDGETVTAMIDWEEAVMGDPRIDLSWLDSAIRRHDPALADQFISAYTERAGFDPGDLQIWSEFLEVRYQIVHAWINHAIANRRPLPSANPEAWPD
jgi:aminoglycoside phosphotransferase (APT) family kinase protein